MRRRLAFGLLVGVSVLVAGCGKGSGVVPVSGRVTLEGEPVKNMMVNFTPAGETEGHGAIAVTDADGRFTLQGVRGESGVRVGEYKVSFYPADVPATPDDPADVVGASRRRTGLPGIYLDANQTPLRVAIPEGGGTVEVILTKSGKGATTKVTPKESK
jgi:hypothetical protein